MRTDSQNLLVRSCAAHDLVRTSRSLESELGFADAELAERPWLDWLHPDDQAAAAAAVAAGRGRLEARHLARSTAWLPMTWQLRTTESDCFALGRPVGAEILPGSIDTTTTIGDGRGLRQLLVQMVRTVEAKNPGMLCSVLLVDPSRNCVTVGAGPSLPSDYNAAVEGLEIGPMVGSCGTAAYWNVPVVVENIFEDPLWRDLRGAAQLAGVAACWSQPIRTTNGEVIGAMALYARQPSSPQDHQMAGLEIAAHMVGLAVERDRLEVQLQQSAKLEAVGLVAGGVAHDFNNLLAVIIGNAELAQAEATSSRLREHLEHILSASESAAELCAQMLASAGRSLSREESVDCSALVRDLSTMVRATISTGVVLSLDLDDAAWATADRNQLRQVLLNLLTNAAEACEGDAGPRCRIHIAARQGHPDSGSRQRSRNR